ncbi:phosphatidylglycerophosphatase A [Thiomicrospira sp. ALE5]|uniref:phosphatidylglycerophosphatase A family protein n=1 Tax=Thiomicrospira sp. ALE5 TaxID=748650 RepID=UPI000B8266F4|nr:phosphatidylglycerophosphatase A [Thiomicrospira sp. ALE5]
MSNKASWPSWTEFRQNSILILGFGLGSGMIKKAPGTWGTLLGWLLFIPLLVYAPILAWLVFGLGLIAGSWICGRAAEIVGVHDHGGIVWDEFVGIWLVLLLLPDQAWLWWLLAFGLFRVFDIIKPWPIGWLDRRVSGGFGIMVDDVVAAMMAIASIWLIFLMVN